jgi:hypothetical protein
MFADECRYKMEVRTRYKNGSDHEHSNPKKCGYIVGRDLPEEVCIAPERDKDAKYKIGGVSNRFFITGIDEYPQYG